MSKEKDVIKKDTYETPTIEMIEFELDENIASSGNYGPDAFCTVQ